eukprot:TRINITY_DN17995_c0_g1_i1.p1 TRINITY_DN17995_c0_g1~~TRINITY_DN17995_c0_g1_i1.p1  ORF type:complete len:950 (-),score=227.56 TRINITY_DN17995_c0_g1_i1:189-2957(-)
MDEADLPKELPTCYINFYKYVGTWVHTLLGYVWYIIVGVLWDTSMYLRAWWKGDPKRCMYCLAGWNAFWINRMYCVIEDCFHRPIEGAPSSWIDVMLRRRDEKTGALVLSGKTRHCMNLGSYNYLGFGGYHPTISPLIMETLDASGLTMPVHPVAVGICEEQRQVEKMIAKFLGKEDAMVVPMGFATNSTIIPCLMGPGSLIISDSLNHASIITGAKLSGADIKVFKHNDVNHLEELIVDALTPLRDGVRRYNKVAIIVEGIYSMEGETCPLPEIVALKKKYGVYLYVDEAHSIGAVGQTGRGVCELFGVDTSDVDILMGTFTKSFASVGGYIATHGNIVRHLRRMCFSYIYGTGMNPTCARQIMESFALLETPEGKQRIKQLKENSIRFHQGLSKIGCCMMGPCGVPVVPILLHHPVKIADLSRGCLKKNLALVTVGYPVTTLSTMRARFCMSASHTNEDIDMAIAAMKEVSEKIGLDFHCKQHEFHTKTTPVSEARQRAVLAVPFKNAPMVAESSVQEKPLRVVSFDSLPAIQLNTFDFLGIANSREAKQTAKCAIQKFGCGSCGPRGFYGGTSAHLNLEQQLATFLGTEEAVVYSYAVATPYSVLLCFDQSLKQKAYVIYDNAIGYSLRSSLCMTNCPRVAFEHNNMQHLEQLLADLSAHDKLYQQAEQRLIVTEGIFTTSGDIAPLPELVNLKRKYGARLLVDESLSFGTLGETGRGISEYYKMPLRTSIDLMVGSLETSLGTMGGFCACNHVDKVIQILYSNAYVFSASAPPFMCAAAGAGLDLMTPERTHKLRENAVALREALEAALGSAVRLSGHKDSPFFHLYIGAEATPKAAPATGDPAASVDPFEEKRRRLIEVSEAAWEAGLGVAPSVDSPLVPELYLREPSLALCAHARLDAGQIAQAAATLAKCIGSAM